MEPGVTMPEEEGEAEQQQEECRAWLLRRRRRSWYRLSGSHTVYPGKGVAQPTTVHLSVAQTTLKSRFPVPVTARVGGGLIRREPQLSQDCSTPQHIVTAQNSGRRVTTC